MAGKLQGKVAVVTGSDSGIGQATAEAFAATSRAQVAHIPLDYATCQSFTLDGGLAMNVGQGA